MGCNRLCGQIEFRIVGEIPKLCQCHCSLCRKQGGSSSKAEIEKCLEYRKRLISGGVFEYFSQTLTSVIYQMLAGDLF
jgi:hypothetical protein